MGLLTALKRAQSAHDKLPGLVQAFISVVFIVLLITLIFLGAWAYISISDSYASYRAKHLSPAEHLTMARNLCGSSCTEQSANEAIDYLKTIPSGTAEYASATKLLPSLEALRDQLKAARVKQEQERAALLAKQQAERMRLMDQTEDESRQQMFKNIEGLAHDAFTCGTSTDNSTIISFDYGHYWWSDDGRCAAQQAANEELRERTRRLQQEQEQRRRAEEQRARDKDAEVSSYWPTTLRVDTDMDSFWLANEERTCQTYPDSNGQVAVVACNATGSHRDHNIPVKFWGGVDRNTVSDWKCRRESDEFVCRATD